MDKDLFYISLFLIIIGVGGQLAWVFFGVIPKTQASFQEMQNVSGYIMLVGFLLLPAGLFKDGIPYPGTGAKIVIGVLLILVVGVSVTSVLLLPSAQVDRCTPSTNACGVVSIIPGSSLAPNTTALTFSPRVIYVKLGVNSTIKWINDDPVGHTVKSLTGLAGLDSTLFNHNEFYEFTFTQPGNYSYFCTIHPNMRGFVIVVL